LLKVLSQNHIWLNISIEYLLFNYVGVFIYGEKAHKIDTIVIVNTEDYGGIKKENVTFEAINYETYVNSVILNYYTNTLLILNYNSIVIVISIGTSTHGSKLYSYTNVVC
jgi:hypothetical protein